LIQISKFKFSFPTPQIDNTDFYWLLALVEVKDSNMNQKLKTDWSWSGEPVLIMRTVFFTKISD
jgi:hypothetical protein